MSHLALKGGSGREQKITVLDKSTMEPNEMKHHEKMKEIICLLWEKTGGQKAPRRSGQQSAVTRRKHQEQTHMCKNFDC